MYIQKNKKRSIWWTNACVPTRAVVARERRDGIVARWRCLCALCHVQCFGWCRFSHFWLASSSTSSHSSISKFMIVITFNCVSLTTVDMSDVIVGLNNWWMCKCSRCSFASFGNLYVTKKQLLFLNTQMMKKIAHYIYSFYWFFFIKKKRLYPELRGDVTFVTDVADALVIAMSDDNLSVRARAAWYVFFFIFWKKKLINIFNHKWKQTYLNWKECC